MPSKTIKKMKKRKAPSQSAKLFEIGTKMKGNDGRIWEIVSFNGIKRWVVSSSKKPTPKKDIKYNSEQQTTKKSTKSKSSSRRGPTSSATNYPVGTKKRGNDGRMWTVKKTSKGIKRWVPDSIGTESLKYRNDTITYFDVKQVIPKLKSGKIKKIGYLDITSNSIGIGELLFTEYSTKKGRYNIYYYEGSLIAVHEDELIDNQKFKKTMYSAFCDIGMFAFIDTNRIKKYMPKKNIKNLFLVMFFQNLIQGFFSKINIHHIFMLIYMNPI